MKKAISTNFKALDTNTMKKIDIHIITLQVLDRMTINQEVIPLPMGTGDELPQTSIKPQSKPVGNTQLIRQ